MDDDDLNHDDLDIKDCIDLNKMPRIDFNEKGVNLRELFIEQYRNFLWNKIVSENGHKVQTVAHFFSPNVGKIPFIISGDLIMPSLILNEYKSINFGNIMVGSSHSINISVQNLFNDTVEISLISPINGDDAIFFSIDK